MSESRGYRKSEDSYLSNYSTGSPFSVVIHSLLEKGKEREKGPLLFYTTQVKIPYNTLKNLSLHLNVYKYTAESVCVCVCVCLPMGINVPTSVLLLSLLVPIIKYGELEYIIN